MNDPMKALTIRQPWASLIALGVKTIETRSWRTNYRGPIAIHAGIAKPKLTESWPFQHGEIGDYWYWNSMGFDYIGSAVEIDSPATLLQYGAVIATATLTDCLPIVRYEPEPLSGAISPLVPRTNLNDELNRNLPYGDFAPDRFCWVLTDITPIDPVPAKGAQGLWTWDGA